MKIHKEGYNSILVTLLILVIINLGLNLLFYGMMALQIILLVISIITFFIIIRFFRSPERNVKIDDNIILSAADGKVVFIETVEEKEYFKDDRIQVSVFMSLHNVHKNFYPISGVVKYFRHHHGKYLVAFHPKSSVKNERTTVVVKESSGVEILFRQIAGFVARRIICYAAEGEQVKQGQEVGFIKFGSRLDLFLPLDTQILVNLGDKVKAGITPIAKLK